MKLGIRVAEWATPHVKEWHHQRNLNFTEGNRNLEARNWSEAERHFALAIEETHGGSTRKIEVLLGLAEAQRRQNKQDAAVQSVRDAMTLAEKEGNRDGLAQARESMGDLQAAQGKHAEAAQTFQAILAGGSSAAPAAPARCARKLGAALLETGQPDQALNAYQKSVEFAEKSLGSDHVETASALAELGAIQHQMGNHADAQKLVRRALQIHRAKCGADSPEATMDLHILAASLEESGDLAGAMSEYEALLKLSERQVGGNRQAIAETQVRLAVLYLHADRTSAARELLTHAVGTLERAGGDSAAIALEALAMLEEQSGRVTDAQRWRDQAAKIALRPNS